MSGWQSSGRGKGKGRGKSRGRARGGGRGGRAVFQDGEERRHQAIIKWEPEPGPEPQQSKSQSHQKESQRQPVPASASRSWWASGWWEHLVEAREDVGGEARGRQAGMGKVQESTSTSQRQPRYSNVPTALLRHQVFFYFYFIFYFSGPASVQHISVGWRRISGQYHLPSARYYWTTKVQEAKAG